MLVAVILIYVILIFPLFLNIRLAFNYHHKKVYFCLNIFGFIKIISGYVQLSKNYLLIHISDTKAIIFELIDFDGFKKSFKPFMDYHFTILTTKTEVGSKENLITPISIVFVSNYIESIIKWFLTNKKPYIKFNNYFNVYENTNKFNIFAKNLITFNILMILLSVIKILWEKMIYEFRKFAR